MRDARGEGQEISSTCGLAPDWASKGTVAAGDDAGGGDSGVVRAALTLGTVISIFCR